MYIYLGSGRNVSITRIIIVIASIMNSLSSTAYFKSVSRSVSLLLNLFKSPSLLFSNQII